MTISILDPQMDKEFPLIHANGNFRRSMDSVALCTAKMQDKLESNLNISSDIYLPRAAGHAMKNSGARYKQGLLLQSMGELQSKKKLLSS